MVDAISNFLIYCNVLIFTHFCDVLLLLFEFGLVSSSWGTVIVSMLRWCLLCTRLSWYCRLHCRFRDSSIYTVCSACNYFFVLWWNNSALISVTRTRLRQSFRWLEGWLMGLIVYHFLTSSLAFLWQWYLNLRSERALIAGVCSLDRINRLSNDGPKMALLEFLIRGGLISRKLRGVFVRHRTKSWMELVSLFYSTHLMIIIILKH